MKPLKDHFFRDFCSGSSLVHVFCLGSCFHSSFASTSNKWFIILCRLCFRLSDSVSAFALRDASTHCFHLCHVGLKSLHHFHRCLVEVRSCTRSGSRCSSSDRRSRPNTCWRWWQLTNWLARWCGRSTPSWRKFWRSLCGLCCVVTVRAFVIASLTSW